MRAKTAQGALLGELVATASNDQNRDQRIGHTLSRLLVPQELADYLAGTAGIQMSLDPDSGDSMGMLEINLLKVRIAALRWCSSCEKMRTINSASRDRPIGMMTCW